MLYPFISETPLIDMDYLMHYRTQMNHMERNSIYLKDKLIDLQINEQTFYKKRAKDKTNEIYVYGFMYSKNVPQTMHYDISSSSADVFGRRGGCR